MYPSRHHFHFHLRPDGLQALHWSYFIRQLTIGMIGFFEVLFIYELGGSLRRGLLYVLLYFAAQRLMVALSVPTVGWLYSKIGYRWMMMSGIMAMAVKLLILTQIASVAVHPYLIPALIITVILGGLAISGYYLGFHALFIDDNDDTRIGEQIGSLQMLGGMSTVAAPLLAGLLIDQLGYSVMFAVAMVILVLAVIPLFLMPHHFRHRGSYSLKKVSNFLKAEPQVAAASVSWYFTDGIQAFYWPVLLFIILKTHTTFGAITSLVLLVNSVMIYMAGKVYDQKRPRIIFPASAGLMSLTWIMRFISHTPVAAVSSDALNRLFSPLWWMKIRRRELAAGEKTDSLIYGAAHEIIVCLGYLLSLLIGYWVLSATHFQWIWLLVPVLIGTFIATWQANKIKS